MQRVSQKKQARVMKHQITSLAQYPGLNQTMKKEIAQSAKPAGKLSDKGVVTLQIDNKAQFAIEGETKELEPEENGYGKPITHIVVPDIISSRKVLFECPTSSGDLIKAEVGSQTDEQCDQQTETANQTSEMINSGGDRQLSQSHKLLSPAVSSSRQIMDVKELEMLESVEDNYTEGEDSQQLSNRMSIPSSDLLRKKRIEHAMPHKTIIQGKTLLQKVQYAGQPQKTWQMDAKTGQVLVKDTGVDLNKATLNSQTNYNSSLVESQTRKTIDNSHELAYLRSQRYAQPDIAASSFKQAMTLVADSMRKVSSFRPTHEGECGSTLVKVSNDDSSENGATIQLDSPSIIATKSFSRKQPIISVSGQKLELTQFTHLSQAETRLRGTGVKGNRYGHKRIQSANLNSQAHQSRQLAARNDLSSHQFLSSQEGGRQSHILEREKYNASVKTGPLQNCIEPQNFTVDFDSLPVSPQSSFKQLTAAAFRPRRRKNSRPVSSKISAGQRALQRSPVTQHEELSIGSASRQKNGNLIDSYHQHKMAEQLLQEEEQMAIEHEQIRQAFFQQLIEAQQQDPNMLLKRDLKTGTSHVDETTVEQLLTQTKYDSRQNILLAKNPFIIRKATFGNKNNFQMDTLKAIIEVLSKQQMGDLSTLASKIPHQLIQSYRQQEQEAQEMELSGTTVGHITLQKDHTKQALFSFLGRLQDYQSVGQSQKQPNQTGTNTQPKKQTKLNQGQITKRLLDQNKKRRLWSSTGQRPSISTNASYPTSANKAMARKKSTPQPQTLRQSKEAVNVFKKIDITGDDTKTQDEVQQVFQSGESHKSTYQGSALQRQPSQLVESADQQLKLGLFPLNESDAGIVEVPKNRQFTQVEDGDEVEPGTCYKSKLAEIRNMRQSYEPAMSNQVQVQSIQIAIDGSFKNKSSYLRESNSSAGIFRKYGELVGRDTVGKTNIMSCDAPVFTNGLHEIGEYSPTSKILGKSNSYAAGVTHQHNLPSSAAGFKQTRKKRCQSAVPYKKILSRSGQQSSNLRSSHSQSGCGQITTGLEIKGQSAMSRELSKRSVGNISSKRPVKEPWQKVLLDEVLQESTSMNRKTPENFANMANTIGMGENTDYRTYQNIDEPSSDPTPVNQDYLYNGGVICERKKMQILLSMQPSALKQSDDSDFASAMQKTYQTRINTTAAIAVPSLVVATGAPSSHRRRVSPRERVSSRKQIVQAVVHHINTDLVMCNENDAQTISVQDKSEKGTGSADRAIASDYTSQLPKQQEAAKPHDLENIRFRNKRKTELNSRSRNDFGGTEFQLVSQNSTVQPMDFQTNSNSKVVVSPTSLTTFNKSNLMIFQRSKPTTTKAQQVEQLRKSQPGVAFTNFNNQIQFSQKPNASKPISRANRVQSAHISRRHRNSRYKPLQSAEFNQQQQERSKEQQQICEDCNGVRSTQNTVRASHHLRDSSNWKLNQHRTAVDTDAPTQFFISAIDSGAPPNAQQQFYPKEYNTQQVSVSGKQTMFSPSEQQFVIESLHDMPIELTQQLAVSGHHSTAFASQYEHEESRMPQPSQVQNVKLVGNTKKHRKGLSLVTYPKSFLEGQRHKVPSHIVKKTTNRGGGGVGSRRSLVKSTKRKSSTMNNQLKPGSALEPSFEVVNSQAMIMEQRRIQDNLDNLVEQQQQQQRIVTPSTSIRLGITTIMGGQNQSIFGVRNNSNDVGTSANYLPPTTELVKPTDLGNLNDNSQLMLSQYIETSNRGGVHRFRPETSNIDIAHIKDLHHQQSSDSQRLK